MPYVIKWPHKRVIKLVTVAFALLLGSAHPALAAQTCANTTTSPMFSRFGDTSPYVIMPGGSFEANTSWKWTGGSLAAANEPWYIGSLNDTQSLSIAPGTKVVSGSTCVDASRPTFRFFARTNSSKATLNLGLQYTDPTTLATVNVPIAKLTGTGYAAWTPTPILALGSTLPSTSAVNANIVISTGTTGTWQIDDVYIDPYRA